MGDSNLFNYSLRSSRSILAIVLPPLPLGLVALVLGAPLYPQSLIPHTILLKRPHLTSRHPSIVLHTQHLLVSAWRGHLSRMVAIRRRRALRRIRSLLVRWRSIGAVPMALDWGNPLAGLACYTVSHLSVSGMGFPEGGGRDGSEAGHW